MWYEQYNATSPSAIWRQNLIFVQYNVKTQKVYQDLVYVPGKKKKVYQEFL